MPKLKVKLSDLKQKQAVKLSDLARLTKMRYSTLTHYNNLGLIPHENPTHKENVKMYPVPQAIKRIKEILKLRKKGLKIHEIVYIFNKD